jgi:hypothetical protein
VSQKWCRVFDDYGAGRSAFPLFPFLLLLLLFAVCVIVSLFELCIPGNKHVHACSPALPSSVGCCTSPHMLLLQGANLLQGGGCAGVGAAPSLPQQQQDQQEEEEGRLDLPVAWVAVVATAAMVLLTPAQVVAVQQQQQQQERQALTRR